LKQSHIARKISAIFVGLSLLQTPLFPYQGNGSDFWAERRRASSRPPEKPGPALLAGLPSSLSFSTMPLPLVQPMPVNSKVQSLSPSLLKLAETLRDPHIQLKKVSGPSGKTSSGTPIIIHVQDVHANLEAQNNIGEFLERLVAKYPVDLVALEGASGEMNFSRLRNFPRPRPVQIVANYLLKEFKISGPVHMALTHQGAIPPFVGIDDPDHYQANVEAYRNSHLVKKDALKNMEDAENQLSRRKEATFNSRLKNFDGVAEKYHQGKIGLGAYLFTLEKSVKLIPPSARDFLEALKLERNLDFGRVEKERTLVLNLLSGKMSPKETEELLTTGVNYKAGQVSHSVFYQFLRNLCFRHGIDLARYPAMNKYIRYAVLSDGIDGEGLFRSVKLMEKEAYEKLARTPEERALVRETVQLRLEWKLVKFELNAEEWKEYKKIIPRPSSLVPRENSLNSRDEGRGTRDVFSLLAFESFYTEAEARDELIAENLLKEVKLRQAKVAVLVTGGFHSDGINRLLKEKGFCSITVSPKLTKVDSLDGGTYLSVFDREKTPLEKLIAAHKLTTAPPPNAPRLGEMIIPVVDHHENPGIPPQESLQESLPEAALTTQAIVTPTDVPSTVHYVLQTEDEIPGRPPLTAGMEVSFESQGEISSMNPIKPPGEQASRHLADWLTHPLESLEVWMSSAFGNKYAKKLDARLPTIKGRIDMVCARLSRKNQASRAKNLRKTFKEIFEDDFYRPFSNIPVSFEIVDGLERTAQVNLKKGIILLTSKLLDYPDLLKAELMEEVHHLVAHFLWTKFEGKGLSYEERAAEEVFLDVRKLMSFRDLSVVDRAVYLYELLQEFDTWDEKGFHNPLICSLPSGEIRDVIDKVETLAKAGPEDRKGNRERLIEYLGQLKSYLSFYDSAKLDYFFFSKEAIKSLVSFYPRSETYKEYSDYFKRGDRAFRTIKDFDTYEAKFGELRGKYVQQQEEQRKFGQLGPKPLIVFMLAGGESTRFFPLPKFLIDITRAGFKLIEIAFGLLTRSYVDLVHPTFVEASNIPKSVFAVTLPRYKGHIRSVLGRNLPEENILEFPEGRGTAGALIWMMVNAWIRTDKNPKAIISNINTDHLVSEGPEGVMKWRAAHLKAVQALQEEPEGEHRIVGIGFKPESENPEEWPRFGIYGLSEKDSVLEGKARRATQFVEAATVEQAKEMKQQGDVLVSVGHYMATLETWEMVLEQISSLEGNRKYRIYETYMSMRDAAERKEWGNVAEYFKKLPKKVRVPWREEEVEFSYAFGLLEPLSRAGVFSSDEKGTPKVYVVQSDYSFADVGDWAQWFEKYGVPKGDGSKTNNPGNVDIADGIRVSKSVVYAQSRFGDVEETNRRIVIETDLSDLVIVHALSGDVLVTKRENLGIKLKQFIEKLKERYGEGLPRKIEEGCNSKVDFPHPEREEGTVIVWGVDDLIIEKDGATLTVKALPAEPPNQDKVMRSGFEIPQDRVAGAVASLVKGANGDGKAGSSSLSINQLANQLGAPANWGLGDVGLSPELKSELNQTGRERKGTILAHWVSYVANLISNAGRTLRDGLETIRLRNEKKENLFVVALNENRDPQKLDKELADLALMVQAVELEGKEILIIVHGTGKERDGILNLVNMIPGIRRNGIAVVTVEGSRINLNELFENAYKQWRLPTLQLLLENGALDSLSIHFFSHRPDLYVWNEVLDRILTMWSDYGAGFVEFRPGYLRTITEVGRLALEKA